MRMKLGDNLSAKQEQEVRREASDARKTEIDGKAPRSLVSAFSALLQAW